MTDVRSFLSVFASNFGVLILQTFTGLALARFLGPSHRGEYAIATLWPAMLASLVHPGYLQACVFFTSRDGADRRGLYGTLLAIGLLLGLVVSIGPALALPHILKAQRPEVIRAAVWLSWLNLPIILQFFHTSFLQGAMRMRAFSIQRVVVPATYAVLVGALILLGRFHFASSVLALCAANIIGLVTSVIAVRPWKTASLSTDARLIRPIVRYAAKGHFSIVAAQANGRLDQMVLSLMVAPIEIGYYAIAATVSGVISCVGLSVGSVLFASGARLRTGEALRYIGRGMRLNVAITVPTVALMALVAPWVIPFVFGASYHASILPCEILLVGAIPLGLTYPLYDSLRSQDLGLIPTISEAVGLVVTIGLLFALVPSMGIIGAAITSLIAYTVAASVGVILGVRNVPVQWADWVIPRREDLDSAVSSLRRSLRRAAQADIPGDAGRMPGTVYAPAPPAERDAAPAVLNGTANDD